MKRIWFALVFVVLCASFCVFEQAYVKDCCDNMTAILTQAQKYEKENNKTLRNEKIEELQNYWQKKNDFLFAFSEHGGLDELAENIRSLKMAHNMKSALAETKALVGIYYENEKLSFSNVL